MYELARGAARTIHSPYQGEWLEGYTYVYYALVFRSKWYFAWTCCKTVDSTGCRRETRSGVRNSHPIESCLEMLLVRISGRALSLANVFLSALLVIAGFIWINADRRLPQVAL